MQNSQKQTAKLFLLVMAFLLTACSTVRSVVPSIVPSPVRTIHGLDQDKQDWQAGNFHQIADRNMACKTSDEGCSQRHLIKGDACFRVQGYECAVTHLNLGIEQTAQWGEGLDLNRAQTYINLLESLRAVQDTKKGKEADAITKQLFQTSERFLAVELNHPAGVYFLNGAKFTLLRKEFLHPTDTSRLCRDVNGMINALQQVGDTQYAANVKQLLSDITGAKRTVSGC